MLNLIRKLRFRWDTRRGSAYETGWLELEQGNLSRAASIWTPLAQRGNASAMYGLGLIAGQPQGSGDMQQAAIWMRKAADRGLSIAYTALGRMYEIGDPFVQDFQEAERLYAHAAHAGEPNAQVCLGQLYERGDGVEKNLDEAFRWYGRAAVIGDADAMNRLRPEADSPNLA